tara:strand:+ start:11793 stop:12041 length:249 start_codon:yes stop_codon:yes gene_type:complete
MFGQNAAGSNPMGSLCKPFLHLMNIYPLHSLSTPRNQPHLQGKMYLPDQLDNNRKRIRNVQPVVQYTVRGFHQSTWSGKEHS